jgi:hypothetical protein
MTKPSHNRNDLVLRREVAAIRRLKKRAILRGKAFLADIVEIGKRLSRVKDRVGHGSWLPWLRKNFDWSGETATNYMNIFALSKTPEFQRLQNLPVDALYLLARRNVSPEARIAITERAKAGEKITPQHVRHIIRPHQERRERLTIYPSPSQERRELTLPPPSDKAIADQVWESVLDLARHGLRTDWNTALEQKLTALDDPPQERRVRALLQERCSDEIARVTTELEHLQAIEQSLRETPRPHLSPVSTDEPTKH